MEEGEEDVRAFGGGGGDSREVLRFLVGSIFLAAKEGKGRQKDGPVAFLAECLPRASEQSSSVREKKRESVCVSK